jgi:hypothetical protein
MATRQELQEAFRAADARLDRLRPLMEQHENDALLDDGGKWSVRDALSHVAATGRVSMAGQRALDRVRGQAPPPAPAPGGPSVDERNQQQIADRSGKSVADLIAETKQAHATALEDIAKLDDDALATPVPDLQPTRPGSSVGGAILRMLEYHESGQLDRIEAALRLRTRWG